MFDPNETFKALNRQNVTLPDPVPEHPLLDGKKEIGRGEYSIVLDKGDGERVYKVITSPADYFLLTADDRPQGPHFPIVYCDHGVIGRAQSGYMFHLLEMERLYPLAPGSTAAYKAAKLIELYWDTCLKWRKLRLDMGTIALQQMIINPNPFLAGQMTILSSLKALSEFIDSYEIKPDLLKADNLMMRKDGTLVFSDPVFIV